MSVGQGVPVLGFPEQSGVVLGGHLLGFCWYDGWGWKSTVQGFPQWAPARASHMGGAVSL